MKVVLEPTGIGAGTVLRRKSDGRFEAVQDEVAIEEALEIRLNGEPLAVTMRTPGDDEELAAGFLLTEALIGGKGDLNALSCATTPDGGVVYASVGPADTLEHELAHPNKSHPVVAAAVPGGRNARAAQRFGTISSSCGLCGKARLELIRQHFPPVTAQPRVPVATLLSLPARLRAEQGNFARTGGIHAAGLFDLASEQIILREDVGRHNAVDKVIGRALLDDLLPLTNHVLMVSGRASFEIVQKALAAGLALIASVSAPSSMAVNFARESGITLIGFLRPPTFNIYSHIQRVLLE